MREPKLSAFVLMPFSRDFDDIYQFGIKAACEELRINCERGDEVDSAGKIYDKIISSISKADIIIADLTGTNANVYYETGFAHALKKLTIHLCHSIAEIPLDLRGFQHIEYSGRIIDLRNGLKRQLEWASAYVRTEKTSSTSSKMRRAR